MPSPLGFIRDSLGTLSAAAATGDAPRLLLGPARVRLLVQPNAVREVLVTQQRNFRGLAFEAVRRIAGDGVLQVQGDAHRRQRRVLQPAFHRERLTSYGDVMVAHANRWNAARHNGEVLALREQMVALTLGIVGEALFGDADAAAVDDVRAYLDAGLSLYGPLTLPIARWLEHLPLPAARRFVAQRERLDARIAAMLTKRADETRRGATSRDDLLAMLLAARDAEHEDAASGPALAPLNNRWVRDEIMTLVLAGHETTASALTWTWKLLAEHPDVEKRLHAEVDALGGATLNMADMARLPYTRAVFDEALRLWPTIPFVFRRASTDVSIGDGADGVAVKKGEIVCLSPWVTQRDARWWESPQEFRPERWLGDVSREQRPRFAWFPFGGGARVCIGEHFATAEAVLILATVAQRWRLALDERYPMQWPARVDATAPTRPPESWRVRVVSRTS